MTTTYKIVDFGTDNDFSREKWVKEKLVAIPSGFRILDAGAGDQHHKEFCSHLEYVSQDIGQYNGSGDGKGLQTGNYEFGKLDIISDIVNIPEEDNSFDVILCTEVIEHVPNPEEVIKELSRLLKAEGKLLLTAPFCSLTHFSPNHYITGFNRYWYEAILPKYNLKIKSSETYGDYFKYLSQEVHRLPIVVQKYCPNATMISEIEMNAINTFLMMLMRFNMNSDDSSSELLCYGYLIEAEKEKLI